MMRSGQAQGSRVRTTAVPTILDSTLREGEQFAGAFFTLEQRLAIARLLDAVGVAFIECLVHAHAGARAHSSVG